MPVVGGQFFGLVVASQHLAVHPVLRAPADGVVCLVGEQRPPCDPQRRSHVGKAQRRAQGGPRLGPAHKGGFGEAVA